MDYYENTRSISQEHDTSTVTPGLYSQEHGTSTITPSLYRQEHGTSTIKHNLCSQEYITSIRVQLLNATRQKLYANQVTACYFFLRLCLFEKLGFNVVDK